MLIKVPSAIKKGRTSLLLDPENVFWASVEKNKNAPDGHIPQEVLELYRRVKPSIDAEIKDFRFNADLTAVYIDPTDRCNARCPYCYVPLATRQNGREMSRQQLLAVLNKIAEYFKGKKKRPVIIFHASEPLLVKEDIFAAIAKFRNRFLFGLQTNATLLEREDIEFLKKERVGVGISLDAASRRLNNRLRPLTGTEGNFDKAVWAIEKFDGYSGLNVIATMTKFNIAGLPKLVRFLHRLRVPCLLANPVRLTQKASRSVKPDENLMTRYFLKAVDTALSLSKTTKQRIIIANFTNVVLAIVAPTSRRLMCDISPCGGGRCFLTITASGDMIPCGEFIGIKGFSGGNIMTTGIRRGLQSRPFRKIRGRIVEKIEECRQCIYRHICGAPCPAELHALGGIRQKAVFCDFYKQTICHAFKVIASGDEKYCFREGAADQLEYQYQL